MRPPQGARRPRHSGQDARAPSSQGFRFIRVPLIAPVLLRCEGGELPTTAGLGLRWCKWLGDGTAGRTTPSVRTAEALLTVSFRMNPLFAAPPDLCERGW